MKLVASGKKELPRNPLSGFSDRMSRRWQRLPGWQRWIVYIGLLVVALLLPSETVGAFMTPGSDWAAVLFYPVGIFVLLALGLNIVVGYAGLLDLGYVAFFAIGAYSMAVLGTMFGWSFWAVLPVGIGLSMLAGVLLGAPTLRLRGDYLAIVTLGFGEIIRIIALNTDAIGGSRGISGIPHPPNLSEVEILGVQPFKYGILDSRPYYYLLVLFIFLVIVLVKRLERSRVGRAWVAIREDEDAAELMGVPTLKFKLWAFAMGAAVGGAAGVIYAAKVIAIVPDNFPFILSAMILSAVVLGGSGNVPGVIFGAFLVAWLPERFREFSDYRVLIFGAALVLVMIVRPEGLLPSRRRKAELEEGTGGMGALGAEVGPAATQTVHAEEPAEVAER
ncbi:branched-chain amino acid ABC transporter permease [Carbonactinospora thermoautotrophica]|uniref:Inner-membrane translocator n=1 Tax=Carbonactinospora thermoautotrophica TaxID=1469144 RepID=A0A132MQ08_9ACTN|nr:branched-chain amino acid ABC transporter permease [Carbonactinospora thermoautotrophica]KWW99873.1 Inner-membrane translocator [Carbonactinospora thermoautotrophica]MCX9191140.1 branched-chain amino acid ABC transporter permease [Carbonactinospora thermoautotrophica]